MNIRHLLFAIATLCLFSTCETEIDITADYERIPVVYGLIDQSSDEQIILINRSFLLDGNALDYTQVEDSMLYDELEGELQWFNENGQMQGSTPLIETELDDKDVNGIFYAPTITAYTIDSDDITFNFDYTYRLEVMADGNRIYAETPLTYAQNTIFTPVANANSGGIRLVTNFSSDGSTYDSNFRVVWNNNPQTSVKNGVKQRMDIRFNYIEHYTDGTSSPKSVTFPFHVEDVEVATSTIEHGRNGEFFFERISSLIEENPANLKYREIGDFDFVLSAAAPDFTTYLNIGESEVSAVGQTRPTFSNINDGAGIGIFSSRDVFIRTKKLYTQGNEADLREMVNGAYTRDLCFCDGTGQSIELGCDNTDNHCQ